MNYLCVIPARYASSRLPGKPLLKIDNKSVIERTYNSVLKSKYFNQTNTVVVSDDDRIINEIKNIGGLTEKITEECLNGTERICIMLEKDPKYLQYNTILNVQGDEPFIDPNTIDKCMEEYDENYQNGLVLPCVTAHFKITKGEDLHNTNIGKLVLNKNNDIMYCSRSMIPHTKNRKPGNVDYFGHIGLFVFNRQTLFQYMNTPNTPSQLTEDIEWLKIMENGNKIRSVLVPENEIGINTPEDYQYLKKKYEKKYLICYSYAEDSSFSSKPKNYSRDNLDFFLKNGIIHDDRYQFYIAVNGKYTYKFPNLPNLKIITPGPGQKGLCAWDGWDNILHYVNRYDSWENYKNFIFIKNNMKGPYHLQKFKMSNTNWVDYISSFVSDKNQLICCGYGTGPGDSHKYDIRFPYLAEKLFCIDYKLLKIMKKNKLFEKFHYNAKIGHDSFTKYTEWILSNFLLEHNIGYAACNVMGLLDYNILELYQSKNFTDLKKILKNLKDTSDDIKVPLRIFWTGGNIDKYF